MTITVSHIPSTLKKFSLRYNPNDRTRDRTLPVTTTYAIEKEDLDAISNGGIVRLIDSMNIKRTGDTTFEFVSESYEEFKALETHHSLIHYVPLDGNEVSATVMMPDTNEVSIVCEHNVKELDQGAVIQFERFAFCRLDSTTSSALSFWFTHE